MHVLASRPPCLSRPPLTVLPSPCCLQYWQYPQTGGDLPFGTVVGRNILANLHDHLAGKHATISLLQHEHAVGLSTFANHSRCDPAFFFERFASERTHVCSLLHLLAPKLQTALEWACAGWKVDLDVLGQNNTFTKQVRRHIRCCTALCSMLRMSRCSCQTDLCRRIGCLRIPVSAEATTTCPERIDWWSSVDGDSCGSQCTLWTWHL